MSGLLSAPLLYQSAISLSGVYIAICVFITAQIFFDQESDIIRRTTPHAIEKNFLGNMKLIMDSYDGCPSRCFSLYYSWQQLDYAGDLKVKDDWKTVWLISINLFQAVEDIYTVSGGTDSTGLQSWVGTFMPWFRSKQLSP